MLYLWEMHIRQYRNAYRLLQWQRLLETGVPRAREIHQHIKIDLGLKQG